MCACRLDIFDRLSEGASPPIVRPNGDIAKRMDDVCDGFQVLPPPPFLPRLLPPPFPVADCVCMYAAGPLLV